MRRACCAGWFPAQEAGPGEDTVLLLLLQGGRRRLGRVSRPSELYVVCVKPQVYTARGGGSGKLPTGDDA